MIRIGREIQCLLYAGFFFKLGTKQVGELSLGTYHEISSFIGYQCFSKCSACTFHYFDQLGPEW